MKVCSMTIREASEQYCIPIKLLQEYESWGFCRPAGTACGEREYNDEDLKRLGLLMALKDIGFSMEEIRHYMQLLECHGTKKERLCMLEQKRKIILENIHVFERRVACIDYLRHQIAKTQV